MIVASNVDFPTPLRPKMLTASPGARLNVICSKITV
jgi:hypothetical protein